MRQIILDTETTGLQPAEGHRIIEIGCLEMVNRKLTGNRYHQYINPQRDIDENAVSVHGITNQVLKDKPAFSEIAQAFIDFINGAELIIHNAPFDVGFINHELNLTLKKWKPLTHYCRIFDTLPLARQLHTGQRNSLDALCKRYGVDNSQRDLHGALLDANLLAQVYLAMTGGQGSLFEDLKTAESLEPEKLTVSAIHKKSRKLHIVAPNAEELMLHEQYLQGMVKKGKCEWLG